MLPVLQVLSDGATRTRREVYGLVIDRVGLSQDQRAERLNSGGIRAHNRIGWALSDLGKAEALARPRRASYAITDVGRTLLTDHPAGLTKKDLLEIPAYRDYVPAERGTPPAGTAADARGAELDPVEQIEQGISRLTSEIARQLLKRLREQDPAFLEQAVLDLLVKMGYGGAEGRALRIGGPGDAGVDGVIDQDALGLDRIYVQAKRYGADHAISRETIQAFVGALHGQNVNQGIFITTSRFMPNAIKYVDTIGSRVILIDGNRLADLMIKYSVGVQARNKYTIVELDENYFE